MIKGIWHTSFTVSNIETSIQFYRDILGLQLIHEQIQDTEYTRQLVGYEDAVLKVAMFDLKGTQTKPTGHVLELVEYVSPKGGELPIGTAHPRSAHVASVVTSIFT